MKVNISRIKRMEGDTAHFVLEEEFNPFHFGSEELTFASPVHIDIQVTNTGRSLLAQGKIQTSINVTCSRCLENFSYAIELPYEDEWVLSTEATAEQKENALLYEQDEVEIGERIFEQIVVGLPMKFTCSSECHGLCLHCGINLNQAECDCADNNVDPRLADLAKWLSK